jgi:hypothetical protein
MVYAWHNTRTKALAQGLSIYVLTTGVSRQLMLGLHLPGARVGTENISMSEVVCI